MDRKVADQTVVITGASSGIGRCAALHLASLGARVVLTARRPEALDEVAREIAAAGGAALAVPGDVTRRDDLRAVARAAVETFGGIDTWVNNAGVYLQGRGHDISLDEYRRVLDVNLVGTINGTCCALEMMLPAGSGVIVQVSSVAARRGVPFTAAYSASKAGIDGFTTAMRAELWGSGVRLSILYPPTVDTQIYTHARGKLGVMPKPAPPVADPFVAARAIERLARTGERHLHFGWAGPLAAVDAVSPAAGDWLLHHFAGFTYSDAPARPDNLDAPVAGERPSIRAGWAKRGWRGLTASEAVRVLPVESAFGAAALGFAAARVLRRGRSRYRP